MRPDPDADGRSSVQQRQHFLDSCDRPQDFSVGTLEEAGEFTHAFRPTSAAVGSTARLAFLENTAQHGPRVANIFDADATLCQRNDGPGIAPATAVPNGLRTENQQFDVYEIPGDKWLMEMPSDDTDDIVDECYCSQPIHDAQNTAVKAQAAAETQDDGTFHPAVNPPTTDDSSAATLRKWMENQQFEVNHIPGDEWLMARPSQDTDDVVDEYYHFQPIDDVESTAVTAQASVDAEDDKSIKPTGNPSASDDSSVASLRKWTQEEEAALVESVTWVLNHGGRNELVRDMWQRITDRMHSSHGVARSLAACRMWWSRGLRARSGIDERQTLNPGSMVTSAQM